eukprot:CAMPEP_0178449184 /NCGR_PEP_ID=MMETSP0689_2-20121128/42396_1 /TAXON_ID=160604 /ORGANISM="Amphidinium massartii, Strain CS-259" /LENGTH=636 /DNA_ID=CAMNT_0020074447 /DNA_START=54 /DNA_END=1962 /DNA_ORIENTATION=+
MARKIGVGLSLRGAWLTLILPLLLAASLLTLSASVLEKRGVSSARFAAEDEVAGLALEDRARENEAAADADAGEAAALQRQAAEHAERAETLQADVAEKEAVVEEEEVAAAESAGEAGAVEEVPGVDVIADAVKGAETVSELSSAAAAGVSILKDEAAAAREGSEAALEKSEASELREEGAGAQGRAAAEEAASKAEEASASDAAIGAAVYFSIAEVLRFGALVLEVPILLGIALRWVHPYVSGVAGCAFGAAAPSAAKNAPAWRREVAAAAARKSVLAALLFALVADAWCYSILTAAAVERAAMFNVGDVSGQLSALTGGSPRRLMEEAALSSSFAEASSSPPLAASNSSGTHHHPASRTGTGDEATWAGMFYSEASHGIISACRWSQAFALCASKPLLCLMAADGMLGVFLVTAMVLRRRASKSHLVLEVRQSYRRWVSICVGTFSFWVLSLLLASEIQPFVEGLQARQYSMSAVPGWWLCGVLITACAAVWHVCEQTARPANAMNDADHDDISQQHHDERRGYARLTEPLLPTSAGAAADATLSASASVLLALVGVAQAACSVGLKSLENPVSAWALGSAVRNMRSCWPLLMLCPWQILLEEMQITSAASYLLIAIGLLFMGGVASASCLGIW